MLYCVVNLDVKSFYLLTHFRGHSFSYSICNLKREYSYLYYAASIISVSTFGREVSPSLSNSHIQSLKWKF